MKYLFIGGKLPEIEGVAVDSDDFPAQIRNFVSNAKEGDYVALNAFIQPNESNRNEIETLRTFIRDKLNVATDGWIWTKVLAFYRPNPQGWSQ